MSTKPLRAVLFDYGHTLVDFTVPEDALYAVYGTIRGRLMDQAEAELPQAVELVERIARRVTQAVDRSYKENRLVELDILGLFAEALKDLGLSLTPETVRWVAETEHRALSSHLVSLPETIETLRLLKEAGLKIGVVSNAHLLPDLMRQDWQDLGFGRYVDASVVSCELGVRKPHPDMFLSALRRLRVEPEKAVFVGDRVLDDVQGAHRVGMDAILTTEFSHSSGRAASDEERAAAQSSGAELVVDRLPEILEYVLPRAGAG